MGKVTEIPLDDFETEAEHWLLFFDPGGDPCGALEVSPAISVMVNLAKLQEAIKAENDPPIPERYMHKKIAQTLARIRITVYNSFSTVVRV